MDAESRGYRHAEVAARELTRSIRREVTKLSETWLALLSRSDNWQIRLEETTTVSSRSHSFIIFLCVFPAVKKEGEWELSSWALPSYVFITHLNEYPGVTVCSSELLGYPMVLLNARFPRDISLTPTRHAVIIIGTKVYLMVVYVCISENENFPANARWRICSTCHG